MWFVMFPFAAGAAHDAACAPSIRQARRCGWAIFAPAACKLLMYMVGATGLEPVTSCV
jgi:hypothetical protein